MNPTYIWLIAFLLPALCTAFLLFFFSKFTKNIAPTKNPAGTGVTVNVTNTIRSAIIIHVGLLTSIFISYLLMIENKVSPSPWPFPVDTTSSSVWVVSVSALCAGVAISFFVLNFYGLLYSASSVIQQLTLLSIANLLLAKTSLLVTIAYIAPIFIMGHIIEDRQSLFKIVLVTSWGIIAIALFAWLRDMYLITAIHILFGTFLIKKKVLYVEV